MSFEMWAEKYRPKTLGDMVNQKEIVERLKSFVKSRNVPHCIFAGPPGTGKTTAALCLARDLYNGAYREHIMELNASDERGINVVRETVKTFARVLSIGEIPFKIMILDEADNMCLPERTKVIVGRQDYKCGYRLERIERIEKKQYTPMPSVNLETGEVEEDLGKCVDSGYAKFYKITLEDGRTVTASSRHPFFVLDKGKLSRIELSNLKPGDKIVDYSSEVMQKCEICSRPTLNTRFCGVECANIGHSRDMKNKGNPMFGKKHNIKTIEKISRSIKRAYEEGRLVNPSTRPEVKEKRRQQMLCLWKDPDIRLKLLSGGCKFWKEHKGIPDSEIMDTETAGRKRLLASSTYRETGVFLDSNYRRHLPKPDKVRCEICGRIVDSYGRDGIYVHHIDGNHRNNSRENLMFVCPRCHNLALHNTKESFLEKGWKITHRQKVDPIRIVSIEYAGIGKAWNITMKKNPCFILGNGILTHNTSDAQQALRRTMERYTETCRFILIANYSGKIIEPIQSRCAPFRFTYLPREEQDRYLRLIAEKEGLQLLDEGLDAVFEVCGGDLRRAINTLQAAASLNRPIDAKVVYSIAGRANPADVRKMIETTMNGNFLEARKQLRDMIRKYGVAGSDIIRQIHTEIFRGGLPEQWKIKLADVVGEIDYRLVEGADEEVQLSALLARLVEAGYELGKAK